MQLNTRKAFHQRESLTYFTPAATAVLCANSFTSTQKNYQFTPAANASAPNDKGLPTLESLCKYDQPFGKCAKITDRLSKYRSGTP